MFKSFFKGLHFVFVPSLRLKGVLGTKQLKETGTSVKEIAKDTFSTAQSKRKETFTEAMARLKLTPALVAQRQKRFIQLAFIFLGLALLCFAYSVYLAMQGQLAAFILGLAVTCLGLTYAFRYHFWAFQLKHKKLGCSLKEWWQGTIENLHK